MNRTLLRGTFAATVLVLLLPALAQAGSWEHQREGFTLGFNVGAGTVGPEWQVDGQSVTDGRETGGAGNLRLGYAVRPDLVLGLEMSGWQQRSDWLVGTEVVETRVSFGVVGPGLTWYPNSGGFFLRGVLGAGIIGFDFDLGALNLSADQAGVGLLLGAGYEFRLTRRFALGVQGDFGHVNVGEVESTLNSTDDLRGNFFNVTAAFNWYL